VKCQAEGDKTRRGREKRKTEFGRRGKDGKWESLRNTSRARRYIKVSEKEK